MTKIDIFSGFLGAGKTTLIKKLLKEAFKGEQIVLIENEFGQIGIDGGFLKEAGIEIKEMNSGCICCSLVGDFGTSLREVIEKYHPARIIIEPSGVGKLSDVIKAVEGVREETDTMLNSAVTVVDATKCKVYSKNFGEFFLNQIEAAGTILLSRTDSITQEKLDACMEIIREHNPEAPVITTPWDELSGKDIVATIDGAREEFIKDLMAELMEDDDDDECDDPECECHHHHHHHDEDECDDPECECHHHHHDDDDDEDEHEHHHHEHHHDHEHEHHHDHDHEHEHHHHHHHHADDVFTSWGMETASKYSRSEIEAILEKLQNESEYGTILRAKGMLPDTDGTWTHFDYVPGECDVRSGAAHYTGLICVIGSKINEDALKALWTK